MDRDLEKVMELVPQSLKKTEEGKWFEEDQHFGGTEQDKAEMPTGEAYKKLLKELDTAIVMRANFLKAERNKAADEENEKEVKRLQEEELQKSYDLAAQSMYFVTDVRINAKPAYDHSGPITFTRDSLQNGRLRVMARLSEIEGVEGMLVSLDGGRTFKQSRVARDISFEFLPAAGERYEFVLKLKRGPGKDDVELRLLQGSWVQYENIDYDQLVLQAVKAMADAYEQQSLPAFVRLISRNFVGNRVFLEDGVRFDFDMFSAIQLRIFVSRISVSRNLINVATKWDKKQIPRSTGQQQATTGRTTMTFVMEDGVLKLQNMRGNLIYATLSPVIAEISGLPSTVIDEIKTAVEQRNAVQPGAGETTESGGVTSGSIISSTTVTIRSANFPGTRYDFETQTTGASGSQDISFEGVNMIEQQNAKYQEASGSYDSLTTAPTSGYGNLPVSPYTGKVYYIRTHEGNYGKMEVISETAAGGGLVDFNIRFAVQTDGTTSVKTQ